MDTTQRAWIKKRIENKLYDYEFANPVDQNEAFMWLYGHGLIQALKQLDTEIDLLIEAYAEDMAVMVDAAGGLRDDA